VRSGRKIGIGAVVVGLVLSTAQASGAASPSTAGPGQDTITLITGDQVVMVDKTRVMVRPGKGREKLLFSTHTVDGHVFVVPSDALPLVASGGLDRRLFDVTTLREFGYDDAHRDSIPLIVTQPEGQAAPRAARVSRELPSVNGVAMAADKTGAAWAALTNGDGAMRTAAAGVSKVWLDGKRKANLDRSATQIGAPSAWAAGYTGAGVKVAVLDTGVDQTHPDLAGREIAEQNFSESPDNVDNYGHGTHVASIVAGTGAKSGGRYRGIASGASILDGKVLSDDGWGTDSEIIAGMQWAAEQGADIANLSLGGMDTPEVDPVEHAVESLTARYGTLFVIAAGNTSFGAAAPYSISSPSTAPSALAVGAVDRDDSLAGFSNRGPVLGDGAVKPDVTAPGVGIVAALHSAGTIGEPVEPGYTALSGTSMATPHVAGAAALLAQQHPDWTGQQIKATLTGSAAPAQGVSAFDQGAGRIDVTRAITQTVVSEPTSVSFGIAAWPHNDGAVTKTITYRNLGATDVTLDLAVDTGAAAGMFSLSANEVTVPAGGTATVDVTGDARAGTVDGAFTGVVLASAGDSVTRTPVGLVREEESYNLTLNFLDDKGQPTSHYDSLLRGLDDNTWGYLYDEDGSVTIRLPKGRYVIDNLILTEEDTHGNSVLLPGVALDRDLTFDVDARDTRPIEVTPPKPAAFDGGRATYLVRAENGRFASGSVDTYTELSDLTTARLGDALPGTTTTNGVSTSWRDADEVVYGLAWSLPEYPTGFTKVARWRDLAAVHVDMGPGGEGLIGGTGLLASTTSGLYIGGTNTYLAPLPRTQKFYVTTDGLRWSSDMVQASGFEIATELYGPARTYRAGRSYDLPLNYPMFGPGVPHTVRSEDKLYVSAPLFTDRDGNPGECFAVTGMTRLYRDDQLIDEIPFLGVQFEGLPAEAGNYRVTMDAVRDSRFSLTTAVSVEWTFRSSRTGTEWEPIPTNVVRFAPKLDANGVAPAGRTFRIPLQVLDETGASIRPKQLSVDVSYDEGKSWQRVPVDAKLVATLRHPASATSVSLRASATDADGNTVKQTVIDAYTLR
jgi:subtilisin family serine protease